MAVTNNQLIADYCVLHGVTEELHTFAAWKSAGYIVKRGEKSKHRITIWKHGTRTKTDPETGEETETGRMFLKEAAFFLRSQVEPIQ